MAKYYVDVKLDVFIGVYVEAETVDNAKEFATEKIADMLDKQTDAYVAVNEMDCVSVERITLN